jgi:hypothetical protein
MRNAPNVKASLIRKYHIINFPYSTLNGLFPPLQYLVGAVAVEVDMLVIQFRLQIYWLLVKRAYKMISFFYLWLFIFRRSVQFAANRYIVQEYNTTEATSKF